MANLHARAIVSLDEASAFLGTAFDEDIPEAEDSLIEVINAVSLEMEKRLGRTFINSTSRVEILNGTGRSYLYLINSPAVTITTFEERITGNTWLTVSSSWIINSEYADDSTLYASSTKIYSPNGEIFARGSKNYRITYVPAWTTRGTIPIIVKHNAMKLIDMRLKQKERRLTGVTSVTVDDESQSVSFNWPREVVDALMVYNNNFP